MVGEMLTVATMPAPRAQGVAVGERSGVGVGAAVRVGFGRGTVAVAVGVSGVLVGVGPGVSDGLGTAGVSPAAVTVSAMAAWTTTGVATNDSDCGAQAARLAHTKQPITRYKGRRLIEGSFISR